MTSSRPSTVDRRSVLALAASVVAFSTSGCLGSIEEFVRSTTNDAPPEADGYRVETVVDGLEHPWGLAFLPDGDRLLVTEREGRLRLVDRTAGSAEAIDGVPDVYASGQGGLLDVTLHPEYPAEPWVYLTYSIADDGESTTALGRGRLDPDDPSALAEFERLHAAEPFVDSDGHFGSRAVFGEDGAIYVTIGDRQFKDFGPDHVAQDTSTELGATLRLAPDGSIPDDNPFADDGDAADSLYSYGHRNAQGMAVHPETGALWQSEHGEEDGDEINVVEAGGNYGWPIADSGCEYGTDDPVGDDPADVEDVVEPVYEWECNSGGFPPGGIAFYDGEAFPEWRGDLFVCNLAGGYVGRFTVDGRDIDLVESLLPDEGWRLRDVAVAPDTGHLYVAIDDDDAPIVRVVPE